MGVFDESIEFREATRDDIDNIMKFIRDYWPRPNHILGIDRGFFEYEFCDGDRVGYYLAVDKKTNIIAACEGIYYYSNPHVPGVSDISGGMFLANPQCKIPMVGIELMKRKIQYLKPRSLVGPGVNISTSGLLYRKFLKQDVSRMKHFYMLSDRENYNIAKIKNKVISRIREQEQHGLQRYDTIEELYKGFDEEKYKGRKPYKDREFVKKRYFNHPVNKYLFYGIGRDAVVIAREVSANQAKILRIIDILGDTSLIANIGKEFHRLMVEHNYEYIDLYELAMDDDAIIRAGFTEREPDSENIIPNYFEPYICKNVEIYVQRLDTETLCFKGDGDQDRPNII